MILDPALVQAIVPAWAASQLVTHTPTEDTYGRTCDERGCIVCNGGTDALPDLAEHLTARFDPQEAADALDLLAEWLRGQ